MRIAIFSIGRLREKYFLEAAGEYIKRLSRFGGVDVVEFPDLPEPKNASPADIDRLIRQECAPLVARLKPRDHIIALSIEGRRPDSPSFASRLRAIEEGGAGRLVFLIGGSSGLSPEALACAQELLSFSPMTFPHQLARIMLLEQLYRARKINAGEAYHK